MFLTYFNTEIFWVLCRNNKILLYCSIEVISKKTRNVFCIAEQAVVSLKESCCFKMYWLSALLLELILRQPYSNVLTNEYLQYIVSPCWARYLQPPPINLLCIHLASACLMATINSTIYNSINPTGFWDGLWGNLFRACAVGTRMRGCSG